MMADKARQTGSTRVRVPVAFAATLMIAGAHFLNAPAALAHEAVDEGIRAYGVAEFDRALDRFAAALEGSGLDRAALLELLVYRALVFQALDREAERDADLRALALIAPDHPLVPAAPPPLRAAFAAMVDHTTPLRVSVSAQRRGEAVELVGHADPEGNGIVDAMRISIRVDDGEWQTHRDRVVVPLAAAARLAYHIEAIGPAGVVLARSGSRQSPLQYPAIRGLPADATSRDGRPSPELSGTGQQTDRRTATTVDEDGGATWVWWVAALALAAGAAAAGIVYAATATAETDDTQFGLPIIDLPMP